MSSDPPSSTTGMYNALIGLGSAPDLSTSTKSSSMNPLTMAATITGLDDLSERPFPCKFCEARFKKKQHLQNHERIHTGEKYVCVLCGQGFSRLHILKHHVIRKHNERPQFSF